MNYKEFWLNGSGSPVHDERFVMRFANVDDSGYAYQPGCCPVWHCACIIVFRAFGRLVVYLGTCWLFRLRIHITYLCSHIYIYISKQGCVCLTEIAKTCNMATSWDALFDMVCRSKRWFWEFDIRRGGINAEVRKTLVWSFCVLRRESSTSVWCGNPIRFTADES